ncbi:hypothetical protein PsYK624_012530 [Phanerochaete sordida]|uniref:Uncharacterized protein n=1 Tax=Phanerochaete sordida TaxID=48140 RepID=A0A9P3FZG7_9APHY|nr:hypothetical protein PsYK624_012530 [Phanerochaete sordida]
MSRRSRRVRSSGYSISDSCVIFRRKAKIKFSQDYTNIKYDPLNAAMAGNDAYLDLWSWSPTTNFVTALAPNFLLPFPL